VTIGQASATSESGGISSSKEDPAVDGPHARGIAAVPPRSRIVPRFKGVAAVQARIRGVATVGARFRGTATVAPALPSDPADLSSPPPLDALRQSELHVDEPQKSAPPRWRVTPAALIGAVVALTGMIVCVQSARGLSVGRIGDAGLAVELSWRYWVGFCMMQYTFFAAIITRRPPSWLLTLLTAGLVVAIYGAAALAVGFPRGEATWRHLGIIDHLTRVGSIDATIDAYFGWPGFFAAFAVFGKATGIPLVQVALWAPVWNNALWLLALGALISQLTSDRRHLWLTVWIFASVNWIDQDYFSPQAFAFLLYLVILALILRLLRANSPVAVLLRLRKARARLGSAWTRISRRAGPADPGTDPTDATGGSSLMTAHAAVPPRARSLILVTGLATAMVASHQLTPFALLLTVAALVLVGRLATPRLPLVLLLILAAWLILPASAYLAGHPVTATLGDLATVADKNLTNRISGTPERLMVLRLRMIVTAVVWLLAAVGLLRRWRTGHRDVVCVALAVAPFLLLPAQSYGGEMLLRVTLYTLPFMAFLAAAAVSPPMGEGILHRAHRPIAAALATGFCLVLGVASVGARYGNARFDVFTSGDIAGVEALYAEARPGDVLIAGAHPTPWRYRDYDAHRYITLQDLCRDRTLTAQGCFGLVHEAVRRSPSQRGLILLNRANREAIRMQSMISLDVLAGVENRLSIGPHARLMLQGRDFQLYELTANRS
jgi:hypothetical protein